MAARYRQAPSRWSCWGNRAVASLMAAYQSQATETTVRPVAWDADDARPRGPADCATCTGRGPRISGRADFPPGMARSLVTDEGGSAPAAPVPRPLRPGQTGRLFGSDFQRRYRARRRGPQRRASRRAAGGKHGCRAPARDRLFTSDAEGGLKKNLRMIDSRSRRRDRRPNCLLPGQQMRVTTMGVRTGARGTLRRGMSDVEHAHSAVHRAHAPGEGSPSRGGHPLHRGHRSL